MPDGQEALSLIGFVTDEYKAASFFRLNCTGHEGNEAFREQWLEAKTRLGTRTANAGVPSLRDIPAECQSHVDAFRSSTWIFDALGPGWQDASLCLVEIDPLLTFQDVMETDRSLQVGAELSEPPTLRQLAAMALPLSPKTAPLRVSSSPGSMMVRSKALDLQTFAHGLSQDSIGVRFGFGPSVVQVVRFNGRCYIRNGVHRAYAARSAGSREIPCLFRDVSHPRDVGLAQDGSMFSLQVMESANPPTMAHFTQHRAYPVRIRSLTKVIHVSWAEYTLAED